MKDYFGIIEKYIVINPHCTHPAKEWSTGNFAELIHMLEKSYDGFFILTGSEAQREALNGLKALAGSSRVINAAGSFPLDEILWLYRRADLMISGDTGPMHAAAALEVKVISLFGPTLPEYFAPWGQRGNVIQVKRPGGFPDRHCYDSTLMGLISPQVVADKVNATLNGY